VIGRALAAALLLGQVATAPAGAQALRPLSKSDLIRMLTSSAFSLREVTDIVRRNCTSFTPSDRDRADLRDVGADDEILQAIVECRRAAEVLRLRVLSPEVFVESGEAAAIAVELRRGGAPAGGVALTLVGSARVAAADADAQSTTDANGLATFRVEAGRAIGSHPLTVAAVSGERLTGSAALTVTVRPAGRIGAEVRPRRIEFQHGQPAQAVVVVLRDALNNPVPGERVELLAAGGGLAPLSRESDGRGTATFPLSAAAFQADARLLVRVGGRVVDSLDVLLPAPLSPTRTGFVAGHGQRGRVGTILPRPLVFEVRDTANAGLPGRAVTIVAANATATVDTARTDADGRVTIRVRLGERAGPASVTARVGGIERQADLLALPGPATRLSVSCGQELGGRVTLATDTTGVVLVTASDTYGNVLPLSGVRAATGDRRVARVEGVVTDSALARVTLRGHGAGSTNLAITGAGQRVNLVTVVQAQATADACIGPR
jgi:hypothetical protein